MQIIHLGVIVVRKRKIRGLLSPLRAQDLHGEPSVPDNLAIAIYGGYLVLKEDDCVYIIGISFAGLLSQITQPVRHFGAGYSREKHTKNGQESEISYLFAH